MESLDEEETEHDPLVLELLAAREAYAAGNEHVFLGTLDRIMDDMESRPPQPLPPVQTRPSMPPPPSRLPQASPQQRHGQVKQPKQCNRNLTWKIEGKGQTYMFMGPAKKR
jgi:hypothetical protein